MLREEDWKRMVGPFLILFWFIEPVLVVGLGDKRYIDHLYNRPFTFLIRAWKSGARL